MQIFIIRYFVDLLFLCLFVQSPGLAALLFITALVCRAAGEKESRAERDCGPGRTVDTMFN